MAAGKAAVEDIIEAGDAGRNSPFELGLLVRRNLTHDPIL
jgi:hypothetical protein